MPPPRASIQALAERLLGTCEHATDEIEALSIEECRELDYLVFNCAGCGWWHDSGEQHDIDAEWYCHDCAKQRGQHEDD